MYTQIQRKIEMHVAKSIKSAPHYVLKKWQLEENSLKKNEK